MKASTKRKIRKAFSPIRRLGLKNRSFSIISNNCWGGFIYDVFGLKYLTPTIGLYFFSDDYIKFLGNLKHYLSIEAKPLNLCDSKHKDELTKRNHTCLGIIDDVELVFVHYESREKAIEKWNRRRTRVNFNNLLIKYNDQNLFNENHFEIFAKLDYKHKLFFTCREELSSYNFVRFLSEYKNNDYVVDDIKSSKKMNFKPILNSLEQK